MLLRYKINPISPVITPLMSDTIFGHFCWAMRYKEGENCLENFLSLYKEGSKPPVLFSSAFLSGYLPRPVLPPPRRSLMSEFIEKYFIKDPDGLFPNLSEKQKRFKGLSKLKEWNKRKFISIQKWMELKENYSEYLLQKKFYDQFKTASQKNPNEKNDSSGEQKNAITEITVSNTLSRISGTVMEEGGGLFSREKTWYHFRDELDLYVEINNDEFTSIVKWFLKSYLPATGFGKDKSVGMGILEINEDNTFNPDIFKVNSSNACMVLSLSSFEGMENYKSFYRLKTKFGKLGGDFAFSSPTGGNPRPFKKPVLMMEPGSVFFTSQQINNKKLIENIHTDERIRHCGLPVTLPLKIMEDK